MEHDASLLRSRHKPHSGTSATLSFRNFAEFAVFRTDRRARENELQGWHAARSTKVAIHWPDLAWDHGLIVSIEDVAAMKTESKRLTKTEVDQALITPGSIFDTPMEVVTAPDLSKSEKIEILKRWELDARALQRATDESMSGGEQPPLDAVNQALSVLDPGNKTPDGFGNTPTKI